MHLYVLCGSQNKQRLFLFSDLTYLFFKTEADSVYCAVRTGSLNQTDTVSYLKGLNDCGAFISYYGALSQKERSGEQLTTVLFSEIISYINNEKKNKTKYSGN